LCFGEFVAAVGERDCVGVIPKLVVAGHRFAPQSDGSLTGLGQVSGLPAAAGLNGIAAY